MERLDEIRERLAAATPGPWTQEFPWLTVNNRERAIASVPLEGEDARANAALIAHAPADIAALLAALDAERHRSERLREALLRVADSKATRVAMERESGRDFSSPAHNDCVRIARAALAGKE